MPTSAPVYKSSLAVFCAALALIFVLCGQILEASHDHELNESVSSCFQCNNSGAALVSTNIARPVTIAIAAFLLFFFHSQEKNTADAKGYTPRGPPRKSC